MINILISIFAIQMVIFLHELGHFLAAKLVKADVYEFSVGFGPKLFQFKRNETVYTFNAIPLFGYVSFSKAEDDTPFDEDKNKDDIDTNICLKNVSENSLENKGYFQKLLVYLAGPMFNFLTAFILFCLIFTPTGFPSTTIGNIYENTPSQNSALEIGDTIIEINKTEIKEWIDIPQLISSSQGENVTLKVKDKNNNLKEIKLTPTFNKDTQSYSIGISPLYKMDLFKSISYSFSLLIENIKLNAEALFKAFFGWIPVFKDSSSYNLNLSGPVGAIQSISKETSTSSFSTLLILASISISLGIANLVPFIPVLDGGQAFILTIEAIRRKSFSEKTISNLKLGGMLFMVIIMAIATFQDVIKLF